MDDLHEAERRMWVGLVATGACRCKTCGDPVTSDQPWDITPRGLVHVPCPES